MLSLVVGERFDSGRWRPRSPLALGSERHARLLHRMGAFSRGLGRGGDANLVKCGVDYMWALNLCWPEDKGAPWDAATAAAAASAVRLHVVRAYDCVVLCGRRVQRAFDRPDVSVPQLWLDRADGTQWLFVPHPSGLCRSWNSPDLRDEVGRLWRLARNRCDAYDRRREVSKVHDVSAPGRDETPH